MRNLKKSWIALTAICLVSCADGIKKPVGQISIVHTKDLPAGASPYRSEYDFQTDFDEDGTLLLLAKADKRPVTSIEDFDKGVWMDAKSYANLNAVRKKLVQRLKQCREKAQ